MGDIKMDNEFQSQDVQETQQQTQVQQQEKTFSQSEVDRIIGERLGRERNKYESQLKEMEELSNELDEFGYVGTVQEKKEAIREYKQQLRQQQELEYLQQQAVEDGITPSLAKKIHDLESKLNESYKVIAEINGEREAKIKEAEEMKAKENAWNNQIKEFETAYPDIDLEALDKNTKFIKFIKGKSAPLKDLYDDFVDFIGDTEKDTIIKLKSKEIRSTSSSKSSSGSTGGTYGLSDDQMETLNEWNRKNPQMKMSAKEFANYYK